MNLVRLIILILLFLSIPAAAHSSDVESSVLRLLEEPVFIYHSSFNPVKKILVLGLIDNRDSRIQAEWKDDRLYLEYPENGNLSKSLISVPSSAEKMLGKLIRICQDKDQFQVRDLRLTSRRDLKKHAALMLSLIRKIPAAETSGGDWTLHSNRALGYAIRYPAVWKQDRNFYYYRRSLEDVGSNEGSVYLSVNVAEHGGHSLQDWLNAYQEKMARHETDRHFKRLFSNAPLSYQVGGQEAIVQKASLTDAEGRPAGNYEPDRIYVRYPGRIYIFELRNPGKVLDQEEFRKICDKMLQSFSVL